MRQTEVPAGTRRFDLEAAFLRNRERLRQIIDCRGGRALAKLGLADIDQDLGFEAFVLDHAREGEGLLVQRLGALVLAGGGIGQRQVVEGIGFTAAIADVLLDR